MRSIRARLMVMAVLTAILTVCIAAIIVFIQLSSAQHEIPPQVALDEVVLMWETGQAPNPSLLSQVGFQGYIVNAHGNILQVYGKNNCSVGMLIARCYSDIALLNSPGRTVAYNDSDQNTWVDARQVLQDGNAIVISYQQTYYGSNPLILKQVLITTILLALPISLLLSLITARPLARRLRRIVQVSRALARDHLMARTGETRNDEIGQLGAGFDAMADVISRQMVELRQLAEKNSVLLLSMEQSARTAERAMLSRDLHDSVSQHLFSLAMGTSNLAELIRKEPVSAALHAEQLAAMAEQAQRELRAVLNQLRPAALAQNSLVDALTEWITGWQARYTIGVTTQFRLSSSQLPLLVEDVLFRTCQESLNNIARHAYAQHVMLVLKQYEDRVRLKIYDDGQGFNLEQSPTGLGLVGIRERVRAVGGTVKIASAVGGGTQVSVVIPLIAPLVEESV